MTNGIAKNGRRYGGQKKNIRININKKLRKQWIAFK